MRQTLQEAPRILKGPGSEVRHRSPPLGQAAATALVACEAIGYDVILVTEKAPVNWLSIVFNLIMALLGVSVVRLGNLP